MTKIALIIEKSEDGYLGRVTYEDDLIVVEEPSLSALESQMKKLLAKFHGVDSGNIRFQEKYDLSSLFEKFDYLKISTIAKIAGLNDSLLRQYVAGNKHASQNQAKKIETVIRQIGKELMNVQVYSTVGSKP